MDLQHTSFNNEFVNCFKVFADMYNLRQVKVDDLSVYLTNENLLDTQFAFNDVTVLSTHAEYEKLYSPRYIEDFFKSHGYQAVKPRNIVNDGSTLFTTAAVQCLFDNELNEPFEQCFFVNQPVIRTQFFGYDEPYSTSFINPAICIVGCQVSKYFIALQAWLEFFSQLGISLDDLIFTLTTKDRNWGYGEFETYDIKIKYRSLDISLGAAIYSDRMILRGKNVCMADLGFSIERLRWVLKGGEYRNSLFKGVNIPEYFYLSLDMFRSSVLMIASGLSPSNRGQGYRVRKFIKKIVECYIEKSFDIKQNFCLCYVNWSIWLNKCNITDEDRTWEIFKGEFLRNYHGLIIRFLSKKYSDVDVNINLPSYNFLTGLRGTSVKEEDLNEVLERVHFYSCQEEID